MTQQLRVNIRNQSFSRVDFYRMGNRSRDVDEWEREER